MTDDVTDIPVDIDQADHSPLEGSRPMVCLYHRNCADGLASLIVAQAAHELYRKHFISVGEFHSIAMQYGRRTDFTSPELAPLLYNADVYILDFSLSKEEMDQLRSVCSSVTMIDHHASAARVWGGYRTFDDEAVAPSMGDDPKDWRCFMRVKIDDSCCGAQLAYDYFKSTCANIVEDSELTTARFYHPNMPVMCAHVNDYDLWNWHLPDTGAWNLLLRDGKLPKDPLQFTAELDEITDLIFGEPAIFNKELERCVQLHKQHVDTCRRYAHKAQACELMGQDATIVNIPADYTNHTAEALKAIHPGRVIICWSASTDTVNVSLRQSNGLQRDLSQLAERFGGGGHKNAAAFSISPSRLPKLLAGDLRPSWMQSLRAIKRSLKTFMLGEPQP